MRKYEFTGETKVFLNKTLHRIRAIVDFGTVHAGDVGGWIEKEENLNQCGDAKVYGDADVCGDAKVYGGKWDKSPCFIQGTRWSINISSPNTVRCGCQDHTWQKWHDSYAAISRLHNADDVLEEYIRYFNLLCDMYGHEDCKISEEEAVKG